MRPKNEPDLDSCEWLRPTEAKATGTRVLAGPGKCSAHGDQGTVRERSYSKKVCGLIVASGYPKALR